MDISPHDRQEASVKAVTGGYNPIVTPTVSDGNVVRLKVIIGMFGLGLSDVARAGGVSRPYVSRVLSGGLHPSAKFLRHLESNLHGLVEKRHGQVFSIAVTPVEEAEKVMGAAAG